ncbi:MAG: alanine--tRNA ligase [Candidatus Methanomethylicia archaeon]|nr:alanine--tRNA ligase [Candidatus Methanomethylicia archaeon]MCX8169287.1 alanine--tRNA ligase [Candidatus Methanomethylicia archaeon]MDW7988930.1 alanine--tRNA ligase [Nitrososphaerota archaeon]
MIINENEYVIEFFKNNSFYRKLCRKCGKSFWTQNPRRETCGEAPCEPYSFLFNQLMRKHRSLDEIRNNFLSFFEKNEHRIINPYPVVARWRDDIYLTIASIAVFQPFVTNGEADPPANPLVISQPCIRLVDIDNVGKSMKHLTIFEMAAHHAFNYPNKEIYWKDKTVELCHNFMIDVMDADPKDIVYKEGWWEGGGNAGPCFEVCIGGLEVSTLVFMMYKMNGGKYELMPLKVVDTGYGLERILWGSEGSSTIFHSIYNGIIEKIFRENCIEFQDDLFRKYVYYSSIGVSDYNIGISELSKIQNIFALMDYTKCLTFMLADGLVPSNSGGGYLARLLIRRIIRLINLTDISLSLRDFIKLQMDYWGRTFKHIIDMKDSILSILEEEEKRYENTLKRGEKLVKTLINEMKLSGLRTINMPLTKFVELYDSHGVPPELVRDIALEDGFTIEIPENFYSEVAKRHMVAEKRVEKEELVLNEKKYPETRKLFYEDAYKLTFYAKVIGVEDHYVILDSTAFYPEGGGQACDYGKIMWDDKEATVIDVKKVGNVILHKLDGEVPPVGKNVCGIIDSERRLALMRSHSATHLLLAAAVNVLGKHVWQTGAQKDLFKNRLDITHYRMLNYDEIKKIEELANTYVLKNANIKIYEMPRAEAEDKYGVRIYQGGVVPGNVIRIIDIEGINTQACGGLHVSKTGEIGIIKVIDVERIQDGVLRLIFTCGLSTLKYLQTLDETIVKLAKLLNIQEENLLIKVEKLVEERNQLKSEIKQLWKRFLSMLVNNVVMKPEMIFNDIKVYILKLEDIARDKMIEIGGEILKRSKNAIVTIIGVKTNMAEYVIMIDDNLIVKGISALDLAKLISMRVEGKGGGDKTIAQGYIKDKSKIDLIRNEIEKYIRCIVGECT